MLPLFIFPGLWDGLRKFNPARAHVSFCIDLNSNIDDSTDYRFQLIDGLYRIGHAKPFGAPANFSNNTDDQSRDRYVIDWP